MVYILHLLPGLIWSCFCGLTIGNFATNPIYRLPRNEPLFTRDPYCGDCDAKLMPRDLFPVFSWLWTGGRCRYCGASIPAAYTVTEALTALLFVICYIRFGFSEQFILISFGMTAFIMLGMMLSIDKFFSNRTFIAAIVFGMVWRTLVNHSIYGFAGDAFAALMISGAAASLCGKPLKRDIAAFPAYIKLLVAAGVWLTFFQLLTVFVAVLIANLFKNNRTWLIEWTIIITVILLMLTRNLH